MVLVTFKTAVRKMHVIMALLFQVLSVCYYSSYYLCWYFKLLSEKNILMALFLCSNFYFTLNYVFFFIPKNEARCATSNWSNTNLKRNCNWTAVYKDFFFRKINISWNSIIQNKIRYRQIKPKHQWETLYFYRIKDSIE